MKIFVKTLKGTHFEIEATLEDTIADVKKSIEVVQGSDVYPAAQQMLIHQGKVLKDDTTLGDNKVAENTFIVVMLSKAKVPAGGSSGTTTSASTAKPAASSAPTSSPAIPQAPVTILESTPPISQPTAVAPPPTSDLDVYGEAVSNHVSGSTLETTVQQILDMGGGSWDRDTVVRALRAAFNNPERAVEA